MKVRPEGTCYWFQALKEEMEKLFESGEQDALRMPEYLGRRCSRCQLSVSQECNYRQSASSGRGAEKETEGPTLFSTSPWQHKQTFPPGETAGSGERMGRMAQSAGKDPSAHVDRPGTLTAKQAPGVQNVT
ncbi:hypothetical protein MHYP_G00352530 [Metynnis hypsauchen]